MTLQKFLSLLLAFFAGIWWNVYPFFNNMINNYFFEVDASVLGGILPNVKSNINRYGGRFPEDPVVNEEYNPYEFADYIQLMECSGGNDGRDLFRDPKDFSVIDDYDFEPLLASCRGILKVGCKPLLKFGNVPAKLSRRTLENSPEDTGAFDVNVYPPDDYNEYYDYIKAICLALIDEFGSEEVRSWRFGVLTEYENKDWFHTPDGSPENSLTAYCRLYDYTVQALIDTVGGDVFVGAHSMTCSEGLWDEREFIRHCGVGANYATGKKGTRICYLSASYYENCPGDVGDRLSVPEITEMFRETARSVGLDGLIYGVDEGRILYGLRSGGTDVQLPSRTVGFSYQAGFDARLIKQMFDCGMNYFSSWDYCSLGENHGLPLITYFVAERAARFEGAKKAGVRAVKTGHIPDADVNVAAGYNEDTGTLYVMAYNYKNKLDYHSDADVSLRLKVPQLDGKEVSVTAYRINDDCNWFDEWDKERETLGVTDDMFAWSPDDGCPNWTDNEGRRIFLEQQERYREYCRLEPIESETGVKDGEISIKTTLRPHEVVFFEIEKK
ncbi:MAG: hypothetical protein K6G90_04600 [Clostridia bacterium]|nr:hypothetical protein [Clostridia bacterium]